MERAGVGELLAVHGVFATWALLAVAFLLPLWTPVVPVAMGVAIIALLIHHRASLRFRVPSPRSFEFWAILFFLMHIAGMAWTTNTGFGLFDLEIKSPMLLFPVACCFLHATARSGRKGLLFALTMGSAVSVIHKVLMATARIAAGSGATASQEIFSSAFSAPFHPSYLSLYLCIAIAAWNLTDIHRALPRWASLGVFAVLCTGVVLCASKAGWLVLLALLPLLMVLKWGDRPVRNALALFMGASIILATLLVTFSPNARERVIELAQAVEEQDHDAQAATSSKVRWITWSAAWDLFKREPLLGTGTGDIKDELLKVYTIEGAGYALERKLNAHQQFLQSAACLGITGLVTLLAMLIAPLLAALRMRDALAVVAFSMAVGNLLVESMLEVQAGTYFFAFIGIVLGWRGAGDDLRRA